ncbi:hypothetical protein [Pseudocolwellia sp. HL-MZ7]|uniref:hypothetical protein n=1 Tax=Pseudocolwellia sp. HL-MZ7 TaxID=3400627 RepID=UPI003CE70FAD
MKTLTTKNQTDSQSNKQQSNAQNSAEVETIYSGQKPQFQQSANKQQKTLSDHPKNADHWEN